MTAATVSGADLGTGPEGLAAAVLDLVRTGPVAVVADDDASTALVAAELAAAAPAGRRLRLEGLRTTTSPVLRRAVLDRVALGQVDVVVVSAPAWAASPVPGVAVVDTRRVAEPPPQRAGRYVLCRLGAR
ncbi:MAG: hypothetical protein H5T83_00050 [Actinotalea sp.]|nr:hypothetical protein [Actinotalea sp.]